MHCAEAEKFYRELKGKQVRIGIEDTGHSQWFERFLAELKFELWVGDWARIRAGAQQKNDRRPRHLRHLLTDGLTCG
jgi:transposase